MFWSTAKKLKAEHKRLVKQMLAAHISPIEIQGHLKEEYDIELSIRVIYWYAQHYQNEIQEIRKQLSFKIEAVSVANKLNRLQIRQQLVDDLMDNLWSEIAVYRDGKIMLDANGDPKLIKVHAKHEIINRLLDSIQKELEPSKIAPTNPDGDKEFRELSDEEIASEINTIFERVEARRRNEQAKSI